MSSRTTARSPSLAISVAHALALIAGLGIMPAYAGTSGSLALTSDYLFRGVSQTNQQPALQGGIEHAAENGFYVGGWGSNVSWLSDLSSTDARISNSLELDGYLGYRGKFGEAVGFDVGALYYWYPGDYPSGFNSPDTGEIYFGISAGVFTAKYSYALTDLFGYVDSDGSGYLDLGVNWQFTPGWSLSVHSGRQWIENNEDFAYTDWKLGVSKAFDNGFSIAAAYSDTDADSALYTNTLGNRIADSAVTLTFTKSF